MHDKIRRLMVTLAVIVAALGIGAAPAHAVPLSYYCPASTICVFDDVFGHEFSQPPTPINRDVGDAPRNTCYGTADFMGGYPNNAMLVVNNSNFYWYAFRTSGCTGSHLAVPPYSKFNPSEDWNEWHAWFRTSTTGVVNTATSLVFTVPPADN
jgi:hypothetical protein